MVENSRVFVLHRPKVGRRALLFAIVAWAFLGVEAASAQLPGPQPMCPELGISCATVTIKAADVAGWTRGSGRVTSNPAGIDCAISALGALGVCSRTFSWPSTRATFEVVVTFAPASDSYTWPSNVVGAPGTAARALKNGDVLVFEGKFVLNKHTLFVTRNGTGTGSVVSSPIRIDCGSVCTGLFDHGTTVTLRAVSAGGAVFVGWTGACSGQGSSCTLSLTAQASTSAIFEPAPASSPTPSPPAPQPPVPGPSAPPPPLSPGTPADTSVEAVLIGARPARSKLGARIIQVELELEEGASAALTLTQSRRTLAVRTIANVRAGVRVLTLIVPARVTNGTAMLVVVLQDAAGNTKSWRRVVRIPSAKR